MTTVGFVGLGQMGARMAVNVGRAGHTLALWNRTPAKAEDVLDTLGRLACGQVWDSPAEAARRATVVVSMLADDAAARRVYLGRDGLLNGLRPGTTVVEMSTLAPDTVVELASVVRATGAGFVDAPVSGSIAAAEAGTLTVMAGGDGADIDRVADVLSAMGSPVIRMGASGTGAAMKLAVNTVVLGLNQAVAEALVLAERAGIERAAAYEVFANSAVAAPFVHYRRDAFERPETYPAAFALRLGEKDLDLILDLAERVGAPMPQAAANRAALRDAANAGYGADDVSAVAQHLRSADRRAPAASDPQLQLEGSSHGPIG